MTGDLSNEPLSRSVAANAVDDLGWQLLLGSFAASVPVDGLAQALEVARAAAGACGDAADDHLQMDVRPDRVELLLHDRLTRQVADIDVSLAQRISSAVEQLGLRLAPATSPRPVQLLEIAIDALDIPAIRPFWKSGLAFEDEPDAGAGAGLVDPAGQLPSVWFQQMDAPRPQRNRIHFDITVAPAEAPARIEAALAAGGVLVSDAAARAFWILADVEGNEICVCTWQDRD